MGLRTEVANCILQPRNVCDLLLILPPIWFGCGFAGSRESALQLRKRVGHRRYKLPMTVP